MNKTELKKIWQELFEQIYESTAYAEMFAYSRLCISTPYLPELTAERNLETWNIYVNFFVPLQHGMADALTLSITRLFENKKRHSLDYLVYEAKKLKIDKAQELTNLREKHKAVLGKTKKARDNFVAHRAKSFDKEMTGLPSADEILNLLNDTATFLNSFGGVFGESDWWEEGFTERVRNDFECILNDLFRGRQARIGEMDHEEEDVKRAT